MSPSLSFETRRRRRRALALIATVLALAATVGAFALGATGTSGLTVTPPEGSINGAVGEIAKLNSKVQSPKGAAQLDAGVALGRVVVAYESADHVQVDVAWTNIVEAIKKVLQNPHTQLSIGLYEPIHTGSCNGTKETTAYKGKEVEEPYIAVTDEYEANSKQETQELCTKLAAATGSTTVSEAGKLLLTKEVLNGYLEPTGAGSGSLSACPAGGESETWCEPLSITNSKQDALYLVASIVVPGGTPHGQQPPESAALDFFEHLKRV